MSEFNIQAWARKVHDEECVRQAEQERKFQEAQAEQKRRADERGKSLLEMIFADWGIPIEITGPTVHLGNGDYAEPSVCDDGELMLSAFGHYYSIDSGRAAFAERLLEETSR